MENLLLLGIILLAICLYGVRSFFGSQLGVLMDQIDDLALQIRNLQSVKKEEEVILPGVSNLDQIDQLETEMKESQSVKTEEKEEPIPARGIERLRNRVFDCSGVEKIGDLGCITAASAEKCGLRILKAPNRENNTIEFKYIPGEFYEIVMEEFCPGNERVWISIQDLEYLIKEYNITMPSLEIFITNPLKVSGFDEDYILPLPDFTSTSSDKDINLYYVYYVEAGKIVQKKVKKIVYDHFKNNSVKWPSKEQFDVWYKKAAEDIMELEPYDGLRSL